MTVEDSANAPLSPASATAKTKTKVCFVCPKAYPLFNPAIKKVFGGAELDLYTLAGELAHDADYDVRFVVADYGQDEVETVDGVTIYKGLDFGKNPLSGARRLWRAMRRADCDIYMQETAGWGSFLVALFCRRYRRRFVYRTASARECDGTFMSQNRLAGWAFVWALKRAAGVVVQNKRDRNALVQTAGVHGVVIRNAQHLSSPQPSRQEHVLWVGRSVAVKRPYLFLKLADECKDRKFVMICQRATGDDRYDDLVCQAQSVENLTFVPRVPPSEIDRYYQSACVLVNTSESEGFPNTFIEACKWSVPILSLNVNPDGFLREFGCGWCADDNWSEFVSKLEFVTEPERQREYGAKARGYVERHHDIHRVIEDYKALFAGRSGA